MISILNKQVWVLNAFILLERVNQMFIFKLKLAIFEASQKPAWSPYPGTRSWTFIWCLVLPTEPSSQLITLKSHTFPVKNSNLKSYGFVAKSWSSKLSNFWCLLSSHLRLWVSFSLLSSQRLIFILPVTPITFPPHALHYCNKPRVMAPFEPSTRRWHSQKPRVYHRSSARLNINKENRASQNSVGDGISILRWCTTV